MKLRGAVVALTALVMSLAATGTAGAASKHGLDMYTAKADAKAIKAIRSGGYDVAESVAAGGSTIDLVLTAREADRLRGQGVDLSLKRNGKGQTVREQADAMAAGGYNVYRSYDEQGGIRDELYALARRNPDRQARRDRAHIQGREILALKVTRDASKLADGHGPRRSTCLHPRARVDLDRGHRRLLHHFVDNYGKNAEVTNLVNTRELWFMLVANPDGYQYTFDNERLWRKNLRDNDGDGQITNGDGVDLNRNYDEHWNYDNEGSSTESSSDTYRGAVRRHPSPRRRPIRALIDRVEVQVPGQLPLVRPAAALPVRLAGPDPVHRRPDLRRPTPAPTRTRPSRATTPASAPTSTRPTARRPTTRSGHGTLAWTPELPRASRAAASSSPTTRRSCRRSSPTTCRSRSTWRSRRPNPRTRLAPR